MIQVVKKIGNSTGIVVPKSLLEGLELGDEVEVNKVDDLVIIRPLHKKPRHGWDQAFKAAFKNGELPDHDLFEGLENNFDKYEW